MNHRSTYYRTHGSYIYDAIHGPGDGRCVRRTPPWGISDERALRLLTGSHPANAEVAALLVKLGQDPVQHFFNKSYVVMRVDANAALPYGVLYRHDKQWVWFRADADFVRRLACDFVTKDPVREDFPEVFQ